MRTSVGDPEVMKVWVQHAPVGRRLLAAALVTLGLAFTGPIVSPAAHAVDTCATDQLTPQQQAKLDYVFLGKFSDVA